MDTPKRPKDALTFDDVLLIPRYSEVRPPEVDLTTRMTSDIPFHIPILSAAMDKVTESATAVAMARAGGAGIIHRNLSIEKQALEVQQVKKSESGMIVDPITVEPNQRVRDALDLKKRHGISGLPVIEAGQLVGIVTNRDLRFEENLDRPISELMTSKEKLVIGQEQTKMEEAIRLMHRHRVEKLPIVDKQSNLVGLITIKDIEKSISYPLANRDGKGRLRVGAAVGTGSSAKERLSALVEAGADFVVVDTAHGDSKDVLDVVRWAKPKFPSVTLIAGNVATAEGATHLFEAGVDAVKVGMGCGSICTTRIVAGIGVPQFTAIQDCAAVARKFNRTIIADGGIKYSGDIVKALAAGADFVMLGGMLAGTDESPGELVYYQARTYKSYRGMGSIEAMAEGSRDRYGQAGIEKDDLVPEGIEGMVPYRGPLEKVLTQIVGGIRSGLGYLGAGTIEQLRERADFVRISNQGLKESHVHDVFVTKEAPNYRPNL